MRTPRLTSNTVIDALIGRSRFITKTLTRRGPVYSFDDTMQIIPREIAERMVDKGILVSGDALPGTPPPADRRIASAQLGRTNLPAQRRMGRRR